MNEVSSTFLSRLYKSCDHNRQHLVFDYVVNVTGRNDIALHVTDMQPLPAAGSWMTRLGLLSGVSRRRGCKRQKSNITEPIAKT